MTSSSTYTILLVNRLPRNLELLSDFLQKEGYQTINASSYEEFDQALSQQASIQGALVDIVGFDTQIWTRCEELRAAKIPFLVVSPQQSTAIQQAGLSHGARSVMVKPLVIKELIGVIKSILPE
jgi:DNA-binding response OmpR family regulator